MSFNTALSGLNASQKHLDVTANNIANVNTIGFKSSRAEFADVYSQSIFSNAKTTVGNGVTTATVAQQFHQGSIESTQNTLDLAIKGDGFFVLSPQVNSQTRTYTRAGAMEVNRDGYVVTPQGDFLQVYDTNDDGTVKSVSLDSTKALQIPSTAGRPTMTSKVVSSMNLPANTDPISSPEKFDPNDSTTFSASTSVVTYDSLGNSHTATYYFLKSNQDLKNNAAASTNTWQMYIFMDGKPVDIQNGIDTKYTDTTGTEVKTNDIKCAQLQFDSNGQLIDNTVNGSKTVPQYIKTEKLGEDGAKVLDGSCDGEQVIDFNFTGLTQYASPFSVAKLDQDGSTVGQLTGVEIASDGLVTASYSNSQTTTLGKIAMATFQNQQGLTQIGDTCWKQSVASGEAVPSQAGVGICGKIESSALEDSNTNLSNELVELIEAQRNYQANSKSLTAESTIMNTILQIQ